MGSFSAYIKLIAHSPIFKAIIMGAILLNTVTFAVSSSLKPTADNMIYLNILDGIDSTFLSLYCLEFLIKIHSFGRSYWFNGFNCFDFSVLICSLFQVNQKFWSAFRFHLFEHIIRKLVLNSYLPFKEILTSKAMLFIYLFDISLVLYIIKYIILCIIITGYNLNKKYE